jgi:hypothetical protein
MISRGCADQWDCSCFGPRCAFASPAEKRMAAIPTRDEITAALRVLWALRNNGSFRQPDALVLRLWGGPDKASWPLYEIAEKIVKADSKLSTGIQKIQN